MQGFNRFFMLSTIFVVHITNYKSCKIIYNNRLLLNHLDTATHTHSPLDGLAKRTTMWTTMQTNRQTIIIRQSPGMPADKIRVRGGTGDMGGKMGPDSLHCLQQLQSFQHQWKETNKFYIFYVYVGGSNEQQKGEMENRKRRLSGVDSARKTITKAA